MQFKSYYLAIIIAIAVVILALTIPTFIIWTGGEEENPHTPEELAQMMEQQSIDYGNQITAYEDLLAANPNDDIALAGLGEIYLNRKGDYNKAVELYSKAVAINPSNAFHHEGLGAAYFELQLYDKALAELETALAIAPDSQEIIINMGILYNQTGRAEEARQMWQRAYDMNPSNDYGHMAEQLLNGPTAIDPNAENPHQ